MSFAAAPLPELSICGAGTAVRGGRRKDGAPVFGPPNLPAGRRIRRAKGEPGPGSTSSPARRIGDRVRVDGRAVEDGEARILPGEGEGQVGPAEKNTSRCSAVTAPDAAIAT